MIVIFTTCVPYSLCDQPKRMTMSVVKRIQRIVAFTVFFNWPFHLKVTIKTWKYWLISTDNFEFFQIWYITIISAISSPKSKQLPCHWKGKHMGISIWLETCIILSVNYWCVLYSPLFMLLGFLNIVKRSVTGFDFGRLKDLAYYKTWF